jgi:hypothetical protein
MSAHAKALQSRLNAKGLRQACCPPGSPGYSQKLIEIIVNLQRLTLMQLGSQAGPTARPGKIKECKTKLLSTPCQPVLAVVVYELLSSLAAVGKWDRTSSCLAPGTEVYGGLRTCQRRRRAVGN